LIFSAEGGFDIPAGLNPVTQLHEQEMVLPKEQANTIRSLGHATDAASGGGDTHFNHHGDNHFHIDGSGDPSNTAEEVMKHLGNAYRAGRHLTDPNARRIFSR